MNRYDGIIDNLLKWDNTSNILSAVLVIGSQARDNHQADESSDLDIMMFVDDPDYFILFDQWVKYMGKPYISFTESSVDGGWKERRVLFDGALDVDFIFLDTDLLESISNNSEIAFLLERGYRILINKIGIEQYLPRNRKLSQSGTPLSELEFQNIINDFWFHTVWTAKKIIRGEIWTAEYCLDYYMKMKLLSVIECYELVVNGWQYDTWFRGRFIEEWAEDWIVKKLQFCYAHYNSEDIKQALLSTMDLFRLVSIDISLKLQYKYPKEADEYATNWVTDSLN